MNRDSFRTIFPILYPKNSNGSFFRRIGSSDVNRSVRNAPQSYYK